MIILVSASSRAKECAAAIEQKNHQETQIATSLPKAIELLQTHEYDVIVLDESFQQVELGGRGSLPSTRGTRCWFTSICRFTERIARPWK
jgi:hypothetical protein